MISNCQQQVPVLVVHLIIFYHRRSQQYHFLLFDRQFVHNSLTFKLKRLLYIDFHMGLFFLFRVALNPKSICDISFLIYSIIGFFDLQFFAFFHVVADSFDSLEVNWVLRIVFLKFQHVLIFLRDTRTIIFVFYRNVVFR